MKKFFLSLLFLSFSVFASSVSGPDAGGDLSGTLPNPTVAKVNGTTVPAGGALTTGNVLQVSAAAALTYGALNLAGGSNYVTGVLPVANGGTNANSASITAFNNITGYSAAGATGTTSTNLVFSTSPTITTPVVASGLTASGSGANDFSSSTGAFKTSSGANTLSGAVTIADATTPSLTTASGKTNTGFVQVNGKTSGALKITAADAAAQTVTLNLAAQTTGAATLTIPDMASVSKTVAWLESPSFTTPTLGVASATSINKVALTAPATAATLTIANNKTLTCNNTLAFAGADSTTMTFPSTSATIARTDAANTFTGVQTFNTAIAIGSGGTNSSASLSGGRPIISNASAIVESTGYAKKINTDSPYAVVVGDGDAIIDCDCTTAAITVNLPDASIGKGFTITIRKVDSSANVVTVHPSATASADGIDEINEDHKLNAQWSRMVLRATGTKGAGHAQGWAVIDAVDYKQVTWSTTTLSASYTNLASISLDPGEWEVFAMAFHKNGTAGGNGINLWDTSAANGSTRAGDLEFYCQNTANGYGSFSVQYRVATGDALPSGATWSSGAQTIYVNGFGSTTSTTSQGKVFARRRR